MKLKNKGGFSIVLAMMLVIIMLLVAYNLLEFLIPFSKNIKNIENASNAYYQSYAGIEKSINFVAKNSIGASTGAEMPSSSVGYSISMLSSGTTIPSIGKGNSEFDSNWNKVAPGEPIQLYINGIQTFKKFRFRVPDLNKNGVYDGVNETLSGNTTYPFINWQISGSGFTLNSSGSQIMADKIGAPLTSNNIDISGYNGLDLDGVGYTLSNFYSNAALLNKCVSSPCSLKFSIVNSLLTKNGTPVPYLEYQIDFDSPVPEQYVDIISEGKSYGYKKTINTKYRIDTTSEAFDFTVFQ